MRALKIKSATEFRSDLYDTLRDVANGKPCIITHKQGDAVVIISQEEFNKLLEEKEVLKEIAIGMEDIKAGQTYTHQQVVDHFTKKKASWKSSGQKER